MTRPTSTSAVLIADPAPIVSGVDQPDPVTLSEPAFDDQGRLRWGSLPVSQPARDRQRR